MLRPCGAIERFGYYLKNRNKLFVQKQIKQIISENCTYIEPYHCVQQIIEKLCLETEITTDKNLDTVFDCLLLHKCNSLGLARTFSALLLYFDINSVVVGGLSMQNKEQYWNIVQYDPMSEVIMIPLNIKGTRELTVYSCVDLYQSIINKVATYIPSYHINVSSERINIDHTPILYFGYPETV